MAAHTGPAVVLGAITTVGTFYAFLATRFVGLREFGLLTGTGIVFMMLSAFLIMPALVTVFDRSRHQCRRPPGYTSSRCWWARRHSTKVLAAAGAVTALAIVALFWLRFDDDVRNLRSPSNQGVAIGERVAKTFGLSFNAMMIRLEGADVHEAIGRVQELTPGLDALVKSGVISSYESLATLVPPRVAQERALTWLASHRELTTRRGSPAR
jgi:predicted exporter